MVYAVVSDAHANPVMLQTALADAKSAGAERFVFLGDASGRNGGAEETVKLVKAGFDVALMGNHDLVCAGLVPGADEPGAVHGDDFAQGAALPAELSEWMKARPYFHSERDAAFVHGSFVHPEYFDYVMDPDTALKSFRARSERFLFVGHVHMAKIWELEPGGRVNEIDVPSPEEAFQSFGFLSADGCRYLVNAGSIGSPRDGYASYVVWDSDSGRITFRRQRMFAA